MLTASSLSYLGMGIQPPNPEWGAMISEAREISAQRTLYLYYSRYRYRADSAFVQSSG